LIAAEKGDEAAARDVQSETRRMVELLERAKGGDETAVKGIRIMLQQRPEQCVEMMGGELAREAERCLVRRAAANNLALREALGTKLDMLRKELAGPSPNPIERLLVDRVVACWLQVYYADAMEAQNHNVTFRQAAYQIQKQDRAHRRFLAAVKTLATVRRLALPIRVDVSVAGTLETKPAEQPAPTRPGWLPAGINN
jgi:hypothetical protein